MLVRCACYFTVDCTDVCTVCAQTAWERCHKSEGIQITTEQTSQQMPFLRMSCLLIALEPTARASTAVRRGAPSLAMCRMLRMLVAHLTPGRCPSKAPRPRPASCLEAARHSAARKWCASRRALRRAWFSVVLRFDKRGTARCLACRAEATLPSKMATSLCAMLCTRCCGSAGCGSGGSHPPACMHRASYEAERLGPREPWFCGRERAEAFTHDCHLQRSGQRQQRRYDCHVCVRHRVSPFFKGADISQPTVSNTFSLGVQCCACCT